MTREEYEANNSNKFRGKFVHTLIIIMMIGLGIYVFRDQIPTIGGLSFEEKIGIGHTTITPDIKFRTADALEYIVTPTVHLEYKLDGIIDEEILKHRAEYVATRQLRHVLREFGVNRTINPIEGLSTLKYDIGNAIGTLRNDTTDYVIIDIIVDKMKIPTRLVQMIESSQLMNTINAEQAMRIQLLEAEQARIVYEDAKRYLELKSKSGLTPEEKNELVDELNSSNSTLDKTIDFLSNPSNKKK